jgi:hypothetical protein
MPAGSAAAQGSAHCPILPLLALPNRVPAIRCSEEPPHSRRGLRQCALGQADNGLAQLDDGGGGDEPRAAREDARIGQDVISSALQFSRFAIRSHTCRASSTKNSRCACDHDCLISKPYVPWQGPAMTRHDATSSRSQRASGSPARGSATSIRCLRKILSATS